MSVMKKNQISSVIQNRNIQLILETALMHSAQMKCTPYDAHLTKSLSVLNFDFSHKTPNQRKQLLKQYH